MSSANHFVIYRNYGLFQLNYQQQSAWETQHDTNRQHDFYKENKSLYQPTPTGFKSPQQYPTPSAQPFSLPKVSSY